MPINVINSILNGNLIEATSLVEMALIEKVSRKLDKQKSAISVAKISDDSDLSSREFSTGSSDGTIADA